MNRKRFFFIIAIGLTCFVCFFWASQRKIYCNGTSCVTIWKPAFSKYCYITLDKYYGISVPKGNYIKAYSSKGLYVCWNDDNNEIAFYIGSLMIEKKGLHKNNFYSLTDFFEKFRGQIFRDGKLVTSDNHQNLEEKYSVEYIKF